MNGCEIYHEVNLPTHFFFEHPVGTVLGRASYGDNFFAMHHCTVGSNRNKVTGKFDYPVIGANVKMYSGSKIIGRCIVGNNVSLGANAYIKDMTIPDGAMVFGSYPNAIIK